MYKINLHYDNFIAYLINFLSIMLNSLKTLRFDKVYFFWDSKLRESITIIITLN
jgi:hypothetical protein